MRVLVTGGAGFIGSTLVDRLLAEGHHVDVLDDLTGGRLANLADARAEGSRRLTIHQIDVRLPEAAELVVRREPEVVYHLAGRPHGVEALDDPAGDAAVTVVGAVNVFEGARAAGARKVVHAAPAELYATAGRLRLPAREDPALRPLHPHGVAARAVAEYLQAYRDLHQLEHTVLVLPTVYGPRQEAGGGPVATIVQRVLAGRPCIVEPDRTCDLLYVDDAVDGLVRAATRGDGLTCNLATGTETALRDVVAAVARAAGADASVQPVPSRLGEQPRQALDPGRARIHLGWVPWTRLDDGVAATVVWARGA